MPKSATTGSKTSQGRAESLERIQRLQEQVSARNRDLTPERAETIAEELSQAAIKRLQERGEVTFERDQS